MVLNVKTDEYWSGSRLKKKMFQISRGERKQKTSESIFTLLC